jgi:DnaJ-class molecular chaperone
MAKKGFLEGYKTYDTTDGFGHAGQWCSAFRERMSKEEATEVLQSQELTPYQLLGVTTGATKTEIKQAFRKLIAEWHPDHNQQRTSEAEEMSKKIIAAYSLLMS